MGAFRPDPAIGNIDNAIRLALHNGTKPEEMIRARWCETYDATEAEYEAALTRALTRLDPNSIEGK